MSQVTLSDIARVCGVSAVTVSKALSGKKGVSDAVRKQICAAAKELGYEKSALQKRTGRTALLVAERFFSDKHSLYWKIYQEIGKRVAAHGGFLVLEIVSSQTEEQGDLPEVLKNGGADGILVLGNFRRLYMTYLEQSCPLPLVFVDAQSPSGMRDSVVTGNFQGGWEMTSNLLSLGHREIGYVGTLHVTDSIDDRYFGAQKAMFARGLRIPGQWTIDDRSRDGFHTYSAEELKLPEGKLPTAFFCNCDLTAQTLIQKLTSLGYDVPGDISVSGFDHYLPYAAGKLELTTYDTNVAAMAAKAEHVIRHHIENPAYTNGISMIRGSFVEGKSTARIGKSVPFV